MSSKFSIFNHDQCGAIFHSHDAFLKDLKDLFLKVVNFQNQTFRNYTIIVVLLSVQKA